MIRALLAWLLLCGLTACAERDAGSPAPGPAPALWSVESARGEPLGWLFGTIHALPDGATWETPVLAGAIAEAGVLVVEVGDLDPQVLSATLKRLAYDEPVPPLAQRIPAPNRPALAALLAKGAVGENSYDRLETWAAALALSRLTGDPAANGVDKALIARFAGRPIEELEGAEAQLAIFDALTERDQRALLEAVVSELGDPEADAAILARAWLEGDLLALERVTRRGLLADPALYRALSSERNAAWATKLVAMLDTGRRPLVAVGAAHMLGSDGLPALLTARGYTVRRIQ